MSTSVSPSPRDDARAPGSAPRPSERARAGVARVGDAGAGLALASALASSLAAWGWTRYVDAPGLWWHLVCAIAAVVGVGWLLRLVPRVGATAAWVGQLVLALAWMVWLPFEPAGSTMAALRDAPGVFAGGTAPLPWSLAAVAAFTGATLLFTLLDELLIHVGRVRAWTLVPLAGWYVIYVALPRPSVSPWSLAALVVGYAAILAASAGRVATGSHRGAAASAAGPGSTALAGAAESEAQSHSAEVGSPTGARSAVSSRGRPRRGTGALVPVVAVIATALATAGGLAVMQSEHWQDHRGLRVPSGALTVRDPRITLRDNLHAPGATPLLHYASNEPQRLRLAVLSSLDDEGWSMAPLNPVPLPSNGGPLPTPVGLEQPVGPQRTTRIELDREPSEFLPAPFAPLSVQDAGDGWAYDPASLTLVRTSGRTVAGPTGYAVVSRDIEPTREQLHDTPAGRAPDGTDAVPTSAPAELRDLTHAITSRATTDQERAAAIQDYLRSDRFHYDLSAAPPENGGVAGISYFVTTSRTGYCEHFASAMALMARMVGIPSRVVVGFTPGEREADGRYSVTNRNMHAWPELYFEGWGWLRFEPTPASIAPDAPAYSTGSPAADPAAPPSPSASASSASASPSTTANPAPPTIAVHESAAPDAGATAGSGPAAWLRPLIVTLAVLLALAVLAAAPWLWRSARRRSRYGRLDQSDVPARERVLDAWAEVRDTALDLGLGWGSASPREHANALAAYLPAESRARVDALARLVERARYAAHLDEAPPLQDDVDAIRADLLAGASARQRRLAAVLPRSLRRR